jgi:hypothetical protein
MGQLLIAVLDRPYPGIGFGPVRGIFGVLLGLAAWVLVVWGVWAIFNIILGKVPQEFQWLAQIVRIILIVVIGLWFINILFGLGWFG